MKDYTLYCSTGWSLMLAMGMVPTQAESLQTQYPRQEPSWTELGANKVLLYAHEESTRKETCEPKVWFTNVLLFFQSPINSLGRWCYYMCYFYSKISSGAIVMAVMSGTGLGFTNVAGQKYISFRRQNSSHTGGKFFKTGAHRNWCSCAY